MESLAIIAEFNPFHTGHARLIRQVRQAAGPEAAIVIIMSGAFVQRGEPAFFDAASKAERRLTFSPWPTALRD